MKHCDNCSRFIDRGCCAEYLCYRYAQLELLTQCQITNDYESDNASQARKSTCGTCALKGGGTILLLKISAILIYIDTLERVVRTERHFGANPFVPQHNKIILKFLVLKVLKLTLYSFYHTACSTRIQVVAVTAFKIIPLITIAIVYKHQSMCGCPVNSFTSTLQGIRRICIT
ncbi:hypothetical protein GQX74_000953 [Glossina fuscipes]|nr:hypothetical protein GQX74_000953 [Glossina fuscipes]